MTDDYDYSHLLIDGDCDCGKCSDPSAIEPNCGNSFICRRCDKRWSADFGCDGDTPGLCDSCSVDVQSGWDETKEEARAEFAISIAHVNKPVVLTRKDFDEFVRICTEDLDPPPALVELFKKYR